MRNATPVPADGTARGPACQVPDAAYRRVRHALLALGAAAMVQAAAALDADVAHLWPLP